KNFNTSASDEDASTSALKSIEVIQSSEIIIMKNDTTQYLHQDAQEQKQHQHEETQKEQVSKRSDVDGPLNRTGEKRARLRMLEWLRSARGSHTNQQQQQQHRSVRPTISGNRRRRPPAKQTTNTETSTNQLVSITHPFGRLHPMSIGAYSLLASHEVQPGLTVRTEPPPPSAINQRIMQRRLRAHLQLPHSHSVTYSQLAESQPHSHHHRYHHQYHHRAPHLHHVYNSMSHLGSENIASLRGPLTVGHEKGGSNGDEPPEQVYEGDLVPVEIIGLHPSISSSLAAAVDAVTGRNQIQAAIHKIDSVRPTDQAPTSYQSQSDSSSSSDTSESSQASTPPDTESVVPTSETTVTHEQQQPQQEQSFTPIIIKHIVEAPVMPSAPTSTTTYQGNALTNVDHHRPTLNETNITNTKSITANESPQGKVNHESSSVNQYQQQSGSNTDYGQVVNPGAINRDHRNALNVILEPEQVHNKQQSLLGDLGDIDSAPSIDSGNKVRHKLKELRNSRSNVLRVALEGMQHQRQQMLNNRHPNETRNANAPPMPFADYPNANQAFVAHSSLSSAADTIEHQHPPQQQPHQVHTKFTTHKLPDVVGLQPVLPTTSEVHDDHHHPTLANTTSTTASIVLAAMSLVTLMAIAIMTGFVLRRRSNRRAVAGTTSRLARRVRRGADFRPSSSSNGSSVSPCGSTTGADGSSPFAISLSRNLPSANDTIGRQRSHAKPPALSTWRQRNTSPPPPQPTVSGSSSTQQTNALAQKPAQMSTFVTQTQQLPVASSQSAVTNQSNSGVKSTDTQLKSLAKATSANSANQLVTPIARCVSSASVKPPSVVASSTAVALANNTNKSASVSLKFINSASNTKAPCAVHNRLMVSRH
ncbi:hypothetical protein GZH46_02538, partial [Fragariocoptes setiger]